MSKRNFILLIIVLALVIAAFFGFLFLRADPAPGGVESEGTNFVSRFNPFGSSNTTFDSSAPTASSEDTSAPTPTLAGETSRLTQVSDTRVAGFAVYQRERFGAEAELAPALRYVDKASGHISQTFADEIIEEKISTTTIPKVHDAYFGNNANSVIMRYLQADGSTIETFLGSLPQPSPLLDPGAEATENTQGAQSTQLTGSFLPVNVKDVSISPDTSKAFYMFNSGSGMLGTSVNFLDERKTQIFDSPFTEWLSAWPSATTITISTKPSGGVAGYMYKIDTVTKTLTKVLGGINGLTTLSSPTGEVVLYSDNNLSLYAYRTASRNSDLLGVRTLPEKCVWNSTGNMIYCAVPKSVGIGPHPDTWYRGETSFNDQIWRVNVETGVTTLLIDPSTATGEEIDGIKLALDEGENFLFLINKKDFRLWKLELK